MKHRKTQNISPGDRWTGTTTNRGRTVFHSVLNNTTNGDKILLRKLDDCVSATHTDENNSGYKIKVNLAPLLQGEGKDGNQTDIIKGKRKLLTSYSEVRLFYGTLL